MQGPGFDSKHAHTHTRTHTHTHTQIGNKNPNPKVTDKNANFKRFFKVYLADIDLSKNVNCFKKQNGISKLLIVLASRKK
jgi:hypothetical protein